MPSFPVPPVDCGMRTVMSPRGRLIAPHVSVGKTAYTWLCRGWHVVDRELFDCMFNSISVQGSLVECRSSFIEFRLPLLGFNLLDNRNFLWLCAKGYSTTVAKTQKTRMYPHLIERGRLSAKTNFEVKVTSNLTSVHMHGYAR